MALKVKITSTEMIKPTSPTPPHHGHFKLSLLDQLAPPFYIPVVLFYTATTEPISERLKNSLAQTLTHFYPFCGRIRGSAAVDCTDDGALFTCAKVHQTPLSDVLSSKNVNDVQQLLPFSAFKGCSTSSGEEEVLLGVQVNTFECGGIGIGVCLSHKVADGGAFGAFLNAWALVAVDGRDRMVESHPFLAGAELFPPKDVNLPMLSKLSGSNEKLMTKGFLFDSNSLASLRKKLAHHEHNPTRVEAVTALIWKAAMETGAQKPRPSLFAATHLVNIRSRVDPPVPERSIGNFWQCTIAPFFEQDKEADLHHLVDLLRTSVMKIDRDYVRQLQRGEGLAKASEAQKEVGRMMMAKGVSDVVVYKFSSWTRFGLYGVDFGWGRPAWVCTMTAPMKNAIALMSTECGGGIEAWVTLGEDDMKEFECNQELLQFASSTV